MERKLGRMVEIDMVITKLGFKKQNTNMTYRTQSKNIFEFLFVELNGNYRRFRILPMNVAIERAYILRL